MKKLKARVGRPAGQTPVISGRIPAPLHEEIAVLAGASNRSMSAELAELAREALAHRKRFGDSTVAQAVELATISLMLAGERYARDNSITEPWPTNVECRRHAVLAACVALITNFVSSNAEQQILTVESLKGHIWTDIANRPKRGEGGEQ